MCSFTLLFLICFFFFQIQHLNNKRSSKRQVALLRFLFDVPLFNVSSSRLVLGTGTSPRPILGPNTKGTLGPIMPCAFTSTFASFIVRSYHLSHLAVAPVWKQSEPCDPNLPSTPDGCFNFTEEGCFKSLPCLRNETWSSRLLTFLSLLCLFLMLPPPGGQLLSDW